MKKHSAGDVECRLPRSSGDRATVGENQTTSVLNQVVERLDIALGAARMGIWDWDLKTNRIVWSGAHEEVFGYAPGTFSGSLEEYTSRVHPDDLEGLWRQGERARVDRKPFSYEYRVRWPDGSLHWVTSQGRYLYDREGQAVRAVGTVADMTERKRAEVALKESEERYRTLVHDAEDAIAVADAETGELLDCNRALCSLVGYRKEELVGQPQSILHPPERSSGGASLSFQAHRRDTFLPSEDELLSREGLRIPVEIKGSRLRVHGRECLMGVFRNITERKQRQLEAEIQVEFLREISVMSTERELVEATVRFVQTHSGCEAVGIRLQKGEDFPYAEAQGFPQQFLQKENSLCTRDASGIPLRDSCGQVLLECMCGNVICGRFDARMPFFTKNGSFWANDTTRLLATTTPADRQANTRNRCNGEGYESVALIPLATGKQALGLLQLNDRRKGMFTPDGIAMWERVANYLAVALAKSRVESALRESEETYRSLFENMLNGLAHCRMIYEEDKPVDFLYLKTNAAFGALTGLRGVEGKRVSEVIPNIREADPELIELYGSVATTGRPEVFERYVKSLGMWFSIAAYCPARGEFVAVFDVITNRKQAEIALQESEERLRLFIEFAPAALAMFDRQMRYLVASRRWMADYGLGEANIIGRSHYEVMPEIPEVWKEAHRRGLAGEVVRHDEDRFDRSDGTVQYLRWEIHPWRGGDGGIGGIVIFTEDITARKKAESERGSLEAQLRHAQKMESVGRLAGGVAHDFNNLLTAIMGHSEMCCLELPSETPLRAHLDGIMDAAQRSAAITRQLLAFARKQTITPVTLDLNAHVSGLLKMLKRMIGEEVDLLWNPGEGKACVRMDPSQVDQVLANLIVNARDAIEGVGRVVIEVRKVGGGLPGGLLPATVPPGRYVMLAVRDNGCGMDQAIKDHIFEPFFTTKEQGQGTGLGLATVYGIVQQNSGYIAVESEPGKGARFSIYLPWCAEGACSEEERAEPAPPRGSETVLLVEDEPSVRIVTKAFLEAMGYTVLAAESPQQAMALAAEAKGTIALLLTDVVMPVLSGPELARRLVAGQPSLRCLFMSGYPSNVISPRGVLNEGVHFIAKPFSFSQFGHKVRKVLEAPLDTLRLP